jgi:2-polyprenyl-3-methyl-5-hydroxy-6-metoxy-1,4-benzoquinol methylase
MTQGNTGSDAIYVPGYTEDELQRLTDQGKLVAATTRALLVEAGLQPGMRVLDVECGVGDVSLLLAELVGSSGEVVGLDTNARALELAQARAVTIGASQTRFVQSDLRKFPVARSFDAVVCRFVLMYFADPASVLRRLAAHIGPGGIVAFQEFQIEHTPMSSTPVPLWEHWYAWAAPAYSQAQVQMNMGLRLRQTFLDAGLHAPRVHMDVCLACPGDDVEVRVATNTLRSALPLIEKFGIPTADELDLDTFGQRYAAESSRAPVPSIRSYPWCAPGHDCPLPRACVLFNQRSSRWGGLVCPS